MGRLHYLAVMWGQKFGDARTSPRFIASVGYPDVWCGGSSIILMNVMYRIKRINRVGQIIKTFILWSYMIAVLSVGLQDLPLRYSSHDLTPAETLPS